jgi:hypothetical protein
MSIKRRTLVKNHEWFLFNSCRILTSKNSIPVTFTGASLLNLAAQILNPKVMNLFKKTANHYRFHTKNKYLQIDHINHYHHDYYKTKTIFFCVFYWFRHLLDRLISWWIRLLIWSMTQVQENSVVTGRKRMKTATVYDNVYDAS